VLGALSHAANALHSSASGERRAHIAAPWVAGGACMAVAPACLAAGAARWGFAMFVLGRWAGRGGGAGGGAKTCSARCRAAARSDPASRRSKPPLRLCRPTLPAARGRAPRAALPASRPAPPFGPNPRSPSFRVPLPNPHLQASPPTLSPSRNAPHSPAWASTPRTGQMCRG
jgi:hypothetical protein